MPLLLVFLVPLFSYWFYSYAVNTNDSRMVSFIKSNITKNDSLSDKDKQYYLHFFDDLVPSQVCSGSSAKFNQYKEKMYCNDFTMFDVGLKVSYYSIVFSIAIILFILLLFAISFISQSAQYASFVLAWRVSKIFCILQVVSQGALLVGISYYGTVLLLNKYYPQVILFVAFSALFISYSMIKELFSKVDSTAYYEGYLLARKESPKLYTMLERVCEDLNTSPPDNIILSLGNSCFVTEATVVLGEEHELTGKTLCIDLFYLNKLSIEEANAVFAHEMAHFSGKDTLFSKKTAPKLAICESYLEILGSSFMSMPIYYFMLFFSSLFQISSYKIRREREYRADRYAAKHVGAHALINAISKIVFYTEYRNYKESLLFDSNQEIDYVNFNSRIYEELDDFVEQYDFQESFLNKKIHHPFDSHPALSSRINALSEEVSSSEIKERISQKSVQTWYEEIDKINDIENKLLEQFAESFQYMHEQSLVCRYLPSNAEERILVEKYFPTMEFFTNDGKYSLTIDCEKISYSAWGDDIFYHQIEVVEIKKTLMRKKYLRIKLFNSGAHGKVFKLPLQNFEQLSEDDLLYNYFLYFNRYMQAINFVNSLDNQYDDEQALH